MYISANGLKVECDIGLARERITALAPILIERAYGSWVASALAPDRVIVAGGAVRNVAEFVLGRIATWKPDDLDIFVLRRDSLRGVIAAAEADGWTVYEADWKSSTYRAEKGRRSPVDIVLNEKPDAASLLSRFDFDVNAVGWDGARLLFPGDWAEALRHIERGEARYQPGHVHFKGQGEAPYRLSRILAQGYRVPPEDLRRHSGRFAPGRFGRD